MLLRAVGIHIVALLPPFGPSSPSFLLDQYRSEMQTSGYSSICPFHPPHFPQSVHQFPLLTTWPVISSVTSHNPLGCFPTMYSVLFKLLCLILNLVITCPFLLFHVLVRLTLRYTEKRCLRLMSASQLSCHHSFAFSIRYCCLLTLKIYFFFQQCFSSLHPFPLCLFSFPEIPM